MIIGVPKETKNNENRVGMTLSGVTELVERGHTVYIQHTAGENNGFPNEVYIAAGAQILPTMEGTYITARVIMKVKEPIAPECRLIRKGQLLFTCFHFASDKELTLAIIKNGSICLTYETVEKTDHSLPLLIPMSEVARRMTIQEGVHFLGKPQDRKGVLPGGIPDAKLVKVSILGEGIVGGSAAQMTAGLGVGVTIADINLTRLRYLSETLPKSVKALYVSELRLKKELPGVDLTIGSVLIPGDKAPHLITRSMLKMPQPGIVLVDVAIDQEGCFETSRPTTHSEPTYVVDGIIHYVVTNILGVVPYASTLALTNATLPYVTAPTGKERKRAYKEGPILALRLNVVRGRAVYKAIAEVFKLKYEQLNLE